MKIFLFVWITVLISQVYCYGRVPKPKPGWQQPPQPSSEWVPPKPNPQWNPKPDWQEDPQPVSEWQPPSNPPRNPEPGWQQQPRPISEWEPPVPENMCKRILANLNLKELETTPIVETTETYDSLYPCDSESRIKQLIYQNVTDNSRTTCNGVVLTYLDDYYDVVISGPNGKEINERIILKNYTQINSYNNGNMNYMECGIIVGGRCSGDTLVGSGIFQAINPDGCVKGGYPGNVGIFRVIEIKGRCASKCSLGRSAHFFNPPVSNRGPANRILENQEVEKTDK